MMKTYHTTLVRVAFTVLLLIAFIQSASAAIITGISSNGNFVDFNPASVSGVSELYVDFYNLQSVQIDFDSEGLSEDDIFIDIINSTGTGWSGFEFRFIDASITQPIGITPQTSLISDAVSTGYDPVTGKASGIWIGLSPLETVALLNGQGIIDTSVSSLYSLVLTPTVVPVPAAVWLFGSGLVGLLSMAGRKRKVEG